MGLVRDQTPPGERKSGMPLSVLTPAPVKTTHRSAGPSHAAICWRSASKRAPFLTNAPGIERKVAFVGVLVYECCFWIFRRSSVLNHHLCKRVLRKMTQLTSPPKAQPTVYIVDDDQATRKSLRWLVETLGVPVQTFHSGTSFLDSYDPSQAGCLVLDVMMAGLSGLELQRELNDPQFQIPVIVLTGYGDVPTA